jgi:hypothetical protein
MPSCNRPTQRRWPSSGACSGTMHGCLTRSWRGTAASQRCSSRHSERPQLQQPQRPTAPGTQHSAAGPACSSLRARSSSSGSTTWHSCGRLKARQGQPAWPLLRLFGCLQHAPTSPCVCMCAGR